MRSQPVRVIAIVAIVKKNRVLSTVAILDYSINILFSFY